MSGQRRVVITGIGLVTPLGSSLDQNWDALVHGRSGIGRLTHFNASGFPTRIAGQVKGFNARRMLGDRDDIDCLGAHSRFSLAAARLAHEDSGLGGCALKPERVGVYLGCGEGDPSFLWLARRISESLGADGGISIPRFLSRWRSSSNSGCQSGLLAAASRCEGMITFSFVTFPSAPADSTVTIGPIPYSPPIFCMCSR